MALQSHGCICRNKLSPILPNSPRKQPVGDEQPVTPRDDLMDAAGERAPKTPRLEDSPDQQRILQVTSTDLELHAHEDSPVKFEFMMIMWITWKR